MPLSQLLYVSKAVKPLTLIEVQALVDACQHSNGSVNVTGLLLYSCGEFIQLLEGNGQVLETLLAKISRDPRHHQVQQLVFQPAGKRVFPEWKMGLFNLDGLYSLDRTLLVDVIQYFKKGEVPGSAMINVLKEFRTQLGESKRDPASSGSETERIRQAIFG
jgi:hypothetical protein